MIVFGSGAEKRNGGFPLDYYGLSKKYISQLIFNNNYNCVIIRLWGCFGKYETNDRFIKANIQRYINKEDIIIHQHKRMDYFYVNDIIPVIEGIFNGKMYSDEINLTYPDSTLAIARESLMEIAEVINKLDNYKVDIMVEDKENIGQNYYNSEKIRWGQFNEINKKFIGLEKGIAEVYNYLKNEN
jgi:dTDP-4-dehydrorhamnose reductase